MAIVFDACFATFALNPINNKVVERQSSNLTSTAQAEANALEYVDDAQEFTEEAAEGSDLRITLIAQDGTVIADSEVDPATLENHLGREEVDSALQGENGEAQRMSSTDDTSRLYVAVPATYQGERTALRISEPSTVITTAADATRNTALIICGLGIIAFVAIALFTYRESKAPLKKFDQVRSDFVANASHELKTPLTIIDANTEVMEMESGESQWTKSTRKQIQRLTGLVQQLVALSRLDEEKGLQDIAEFDLSEAVSESVQPYGALAQTKEKHLTLNIEGGLMYTGDEKSIRQLSGTLMDNAVKYSSEKGNIALTLKKKGKKILLEVYNDADGLPQGKLDVLFERFYRLDSSRNSGTGGSGIGLSVAQAIVQAHKGKISAENKTGNGLTITVLL